MNSYDFVFRGQSLAALPSGALFWSAESLLCVSDLHLGKSERIARKGAAPLPPYETQDTLTRLADDLEKTKARIVICLGDSFDDLLSADALGQAERSYLTSLQAGREWIWIEGNHDPGPVEFGGQHLAVFHRLGLQFRHIASDTKGEISGHYHPKARIGLRGRSVTRAAFLIDSKRVIMPAFGTYTGGLFCDQPPIRSLMEPGATAVLTGQIARAFPMPR